MAKQGTGLGYQGWKRAGENLGAGTAGGDTSHPMRGAIPGGTPAVYEEAMFGKGRPGGAISAAQQEATPWFYPESSRVHAYQYDPDMQQLRVKFIKYGTSWVYNGVPSAVFEAFNAAPSKGTYINSTLNFFPYRRANAAEVVSYFQSV